MRTIRAGARVIDAQVATGSESPSELREVLARIMGSAPTSACVLKGGWVDTPLGPMVAIGDEDALYLLEFFNRRALERQVERLREKTGSVIVPGVNPPIACVERELREYFEGTRKVFHTPIHLLGTTFEERVWTALMKIPSGETRSYGDVARAIGQPAAARAVARANGANRLALIIPCHRVINASGELGGYGGGLARKRWLIEHEKHGQLPSGDAAN